MKRNPSSVDLVVELVKRVKSNPEGMFETLEALRYIADRQTPPMAELIQEVASAIDKFVGHEIRITCVMDGCSNKAVQGPTLPCFQDRKMCQPCMNAAFERMVSCLS